MEYLAFYTTILFQFTHEQWITWTTWLQKWSLLKSSVNNLVHAPIKCKIKKEENFKLEQEFNIHYWTFCRWRELSLVMITWSMEQAFMWKKLKLMCHRMATTIHFHATVGWRRISWQKWQSRIWIHQLLLQVSKFSQGGRYSL